MYVQYVYIYMRVSVTISAQAIHKFVPIFLEYGQARRVVLGRRRGPHARPGHSTNALSPVATRGRLVALRGMPAAAAAASAAAAKGATMRGVDSKYLKQQGVDAVFHQMGVEAL